ncbi:FAD-dependent oxidoreductase [Nocardiopsis sp. RSe5-2]|uniref:FAD-dependent oxidoreductase n=1 Tax=Nocardiopsis endophytica TaxID=3018445 RepID=A0ABT4TYP3_9ACTN|nr:FAD-dependent oxidoreductase [Nocardiopsis endophytica]MDA2809818.1 FAD-dependent oxidoreductase [Nocardiopsis endophytica]
MSGTTTITGAPAGDVRALAAAVRGPVLLAGDEGFDTECANFQTSVPHRPRVAVGAAHEEDVRLAVAFAAEHGMKAAVQGTGHGPGVPAGGGLLVTTRRMDQVSIDPHRRTARIQAGARWGAVARAAGEHGLAALSGSAPHVGAVGYLLGGGLPLLGRTFGWAADRVRSVRAVTADGRLRTLTPEDDPDLLRGLLGGRGGLAAVTEVETGLVELERIFGGGFYVDAADPAAAYGAYTDWTHGLPPEMNSSAAVIPVPDTPGVPEAIAGRTIMHVRIAYTGRAERGRELVDRLDAGPVLMGGLREMPASESGSVHAEPDAPVAWFGDTRVVRNLPGEALGVLGRAVEPGPGGPVITEVRHMGGALEGPGQAMVGHRQAAYFANVLTMPGERVDPRAARRAREAADALGPWSLGRLPTFLPSGELSTPEVVRSAYTDEDVALLRRLKAEHDPADVFAFGHRVD